MTLKAERPGLKHQQGWVLSLLFLVILAVGLGFASVYLYKINNIITTKFEGKRWEIPAKVYSKPLSLYQGARLPSRDLEFYLKALNYTQAKNFKKPGTYMRSGGNWTIHTRGFAPIDGNQPAQVIKLAISGNQITQIQSTRPNSTGIVSLEPVQIGGIYPDSNEDRVLVKLENVPAPLIDALIATEDRDFYTHPGISLRGTARALLSNISGGARQGGSTITQQLIKNFYLNSERSLKRKANEAVMALLLEIHYSKADILQAYLNEINLGQNGNRSINGFALASEFYFGQPLNTLGIDQQALLVGLAKGPSYYNPWRNPQNATIRRNVVLSNMLVTGKITQEDFDSLSQKPLGVSKTPLAGKARFPDFLNLVQRELTERFDAAALQSEGLSVITTLDPLLQQNAEDTFDSEIKRLRRSKAASDLQGALVSADPNTGEIKALVGGYGAFTGYNRAMDAKRQIGSLVKPFVYLQALESGKFQLYTPIEDTAITIDTNEGPWSPNNYDKREHGRVPLVTALAKSYNLATVRLGMGLGLKNVKNGLNRFGLAEDIQPYPAMLLGAIDASPMQVLGAYQVIAANGFKMPLYSIQSVVNAEGDALTQSSLNTRPVVSPEASYLATYALERVVSNGTASSLGSLGANLNLAGKTGTTNDYRDAWFAGFSGNLATVVWVGLDNNQPMGLSGSTGALPIWKAYMGKASLMPVEPVEPQGIEWLWVDRKSGIISDQRCGGAVRAPVLIKYAPEAVTYCARQLYYADQAMGSQSQFEDMEVAPFQGDINDLSSDPEAPAPNRLPPTSGVLRQLDNLLKNAGEWFN